MKTMVWKITLPIIGIAASLVGAHKELYENREGDNSLMDGYPLTTSGSTTYSTFREHYFDNLTANFGMNYAGSCGYVALGMLLSYYDAYFDANLIPSSYDIVSTGDNPNLIQRHNSPGILHDDFETTGLSSVYGTDYPGATIYYNYVQSISAFSLHAKLMEIGHDLGYFDSQNANNPFATTASQRYSILSYYLQNVANLSANSFSITYYDSFASYVDGQHFANVSQICSYIDAGKPVAVGLRSDGGYSGHVAIAYAHSGSTIYFHPGVSHAGYTTHMTMSEMNYSFIRSYMVLDFNYTAAKGTNYNITDGGYSVNLPYDSQNVNYQNTNHTHFYHHSYSYYSDSYHKAYCSCNDYVLDEHFASQVYHFHNHLMGICDYCGVEVTL